MTPFKLFTDSFGIPVEQLSHIVGINPPTARKYCTGERKAPGDLIRKMELLFLKVEQAADAFQANPALLQRSKLDRRLHRAVLRRIQERNIVMREPFKGFTVKIGKGTIA